MKQADLNYSACAPCQFGFIGSRFDVQFEVIAEATLAVRIETLVDVIEVEAVI